jgi:5-methylcytosine-specific restriction endonuclease McrA
MYKHGKFVDLGRTGGSSIKRNLRIEINAIDGTWCLFCGKPGPGLHLHRVIYGSHGGEYKLNNCVQLCVTCHERVHTSKTKWAPVLADYLQIRLSDEKDKWLEQFRLKLLSGDEEK